MKSACITVAILFLTSCLPAQHNALGKAVDQLIHHWQKDSTAPALSLAIIKNGQPIYTRYAGYAAINDRTLNNPSTQFWVASVTKQFTAAGIYLLAAQHTLQLSHSVRHYLPALPALFEKVTINHLIHHTSGIRDGFVLTALSGKQEAEYTNENVFKYLTLQQALNHSPGTHFEYNNSGYVLLAKVIETVSGKTYPAFMKTYLFEPLGMNNTYVSGSFPQTAQQAKGYISAADGKFDESHFMGETYGSAGLITTLTDMVKWNQLIQSKGSNSLWEAIILNMLTVGKLNNGSPINYGGGLEKFVYKGKTVYEHFGADAGFKANTLYFPATKLSVIGLTNNGSYYGLSQLLYSIADLVNAEKNTSNSIRVAATDSLLQANYYFNEEMPHLLIVKDYLQYATIAETPDSYAAVYKRNGNQLQSTDPIPVTYQFTTHSITLNGAGANKNEWKKIIPVEQTADLNMLQGNYHSAELQKAYRVGLSPKGLYFELAPGMNLPLYRITNNAFIFDYVGANILQFTGNGFTFSREGCRKLVFSKTAQ